MQKVEIEVVCGRLVALKVIASEVSSASEVTTLWRYTNLFIIIIIIIILSPPAQSRRQKN